MDNLTIIHLAPLHSCNQKICHNLSDSSDQPLYENSQEHHLHVF